jgi:hypothetical protein
MATHRCTNAFFAKKPGACQQRLIISVTKYSTALIEVASCVTVKPHPALDQPRLICVVQDGRIVEEGNHEALLALNGVYAALYRRQFAE